MGSSADAVPAISFTIPYYDNAGYLAEAIDSVRAQTESDWELIVVDDAGPEPAHDLVAAYGDERITYVRNERNLGLARNWNECLRHVRAPFATVLHGDDRLDPAYAAKVLAAHAAHPDVSIVFTDVRIIGPDGQPARTMADIAKRFARRSRDDHDLAGDGDLAVLLAGNYILCPTLCFRVAVVGREPFDPRWRFVPDWDLTCRQLLAGNTMHSIREPLLEYRRHASSQTSALTVDASRFTEEIEFLELMAIEAAKLGWHRSVRAARHRLMLRGHIALQVGADLVRRRGSAARQKWAILRADVSGRHRRRADDADAQQ